MTQTITADRDFLNTSELVFDDVSANFGANIGSPTAIWFASKIR